MPTFLRTALIAFLAMTAAPSAMAGPRAWQISESTGNVTVNTAGANRPGTRGLPLKEGDAVSTGPNSRAVLVRGSEFVMLSPNSQIRIAKPKESGAITQVFQYLGSALFKIEKKETPHFGVKTPFLAAVVKGTTFNVTVTDNGATVQVTEGRVEVSTLDGGATDLIVPGRIARVDVQDRQLLKVLGTDDRNIRSSLPPQGESTDTQKGATTSATRDNGATVSHDTNDNAKAESDPNMDDAQITESIADTGKAGGFDGRIGAPISGDNVNIAVLTGGLISGPKGNDRATGDAPIRGNTDNPGNGAAPGTPDAPGNDAAPGNPDAPGNDAAPGNPDNPGNGAAPGNPDGPGNGAAPGNPDAPGNGATPGNPDNPGNGAAPGNPDAPGNDAAPGNPDAPGNDNADNPGNGNGNGDDGANADKPGNRDDAGIIDIVDDVVDDVVNPDKGNKDRGDDDDDDD